MMTCRKCQRHTDHHLAVIRAECHAAYVCDRAHHTEGNSVERIETPHRDFDFEGLLKFGNGL